MELEVIWRRLATDDNFEMWHPCCDSTVHDKSKHNPSMHNFIVAVVNCSYMFRLREVAIIRLYRKYKKKII